MWVDTFLGVRVPVFLYVISTRSDVHFPWWHCIGNKVSIYYKNLSIFPCLTMEYNTIKDSLFFPSIHTIFWAILLAPLILLLCDVLDPHGPTFSPKHWILPRHLTFQTQMQYTLISQYPHQFLINQGLISIPHYAMLLETCSVNGYK